MKKDQDKENIKNIPTKEPKKEPSIEKEKQTPPRKEAEKGGIDGKNPPKNQPITNKKEEKPTVKNPKTSEQKQPTSKRKRPNNKQQHRHTSPQNKGEKGREGKEQGVTHQKQRTQKPKRNHRSTPNTGQHTDKNNKSTRQDKNRPPKRNPNSSTKPTPNKTKKTTPANEQRKNVKSSSKKPDFPDRDSAKIEKATVEQVVKAAKKKQIPVEPVEKLLLGISMGDVNGIGIELIIKTFLDDRMFKYFTPIIYGSSKVLSYHKKVLQIPSFQYNIINTVEQAKPDVCNILNCWPEEFPITIGRPNKALGRYAFLALEAATKDMVADKLDILVTAPLNKHIVDSEELPFVGHTEYLTEQFGDEESLMFLVSDSLRVGLVTNHVPVSKIAQKINKSLIVQKIQIMEDALRRDFSIERPKIAVLALNPHAGDNGLIGQEEQEIIIPAIQEVKDKDNILAFGPYAADGFFGNGTYRNFDAILAMYHDQGLIPFKAFSFGHGVNFTAGLSKIRTSPDHGTAYDIAGKCLASDKSFRKAIFMARDIHRHRAIYEEITANPLGKNLIDQERDFHRRNASNTSNYEEQKRNNAKKTVKE